jgi:putative ABC transport system ATP-binding protein
MQIIKPTLIKTQDLTKIYRLDEIETTSLMDVSLTVEKGEFVAIMGPSGCGKSTLLNLIGLLDSPSSGKYFFMDEEVSGYSEKQRASLRKANIGFVFQSFNLIDELNVFENIELPLLYLGMSSSDRKKKVESAMERLEISHRRKHFPQQLSGGQQQRVAVCRAIVSNPQLILADEPTGNLDSVNGEEVMKLLKHLNEKGTSIVMVTHSAEHAKYANRVVRMLDGKIMSSNDQSVNAYV